LPENPFEKVDLTPELLLKRLKESFKELEVNKKSNY